MHMCVYTVYINFDVGTWMWVHLNSEPCWNKVYIMLGHSDHRYYRYYFSYTGVAHAFFNMSHT